VTSSRLALADDARVATWGAGALFIPSLALLLSTASRTHCMFQAIYIIVWYAAVNHGKPLTTWAPSSSTAIRPDPRPC
jgi:hypothetical protein